jgi:uncharacterized protein YggE
MMNLSRQQLAITFMLTAAAAPAAGTPAARGVRARVERVGVERAGVELAAMLASVEQAQEPTREMPRDVVVVTGEAVVKRAAEIAIVTVTAQAQSKMPKDAQQQAAKAMTSVQQRLEQAGYSGKAVRTLRYSLQPEFDYVSGRQTLRGYVARNSIEVRVDPVDRAGEVVDLVVQSGATTVENLRFDLKDRAEIEREALTEAVKVARVRAEAAATGAGRTIDRLVRVEDQSVSEPPPRPHLMAMRVETDAAPTPIQPGEIEVRARVTVTAQLK